MSRPSVFIKILKLWKRDTKNDGISTWWHPIAGVFNENALQKPIPEDWSNESLVQSKVTQNINFFDQNSSSLIIIYYSNHDFKLQVSFFSSILILHKGHTYIFGELLIVLVLILIVITYIESQDNYGKKYFSPLQKKTWPDRKKNWCHIWNQWSQITIKQVSNQMQKTKFNFLFPSVIFSLLDFKENIKLQ